MLTSRLFFILFILLHILLFRLYFKLFFTFIALHTSGLVDGGVREGAQAISYEPPVVAWTLGRTLDLQVQKKKLCSASGSAVRAGRVYLPFLCPRLSKPC